MAINPYSPCPCGSGKKLKFCCGDLAAEIEKIYQMIQGDQPRGALKHVDQLLAKNPEQGVLLDLKASIELSLHEFDAAAETVNKFLQAHPDSASAFAQQAILASVSENGSAGIDPLQEALELLQKDMPLRVLEAIGAVGQALLVEGKLIAARGHLLLYAGIAPEDDNRGLELLMRMNLQGGLPLLLREYLSLSECPAEVPWQDPYAEALKLSAQGKWRKAAGILIAAIKKFGMEPEMVYSLALLQGWLGNTDAFVAGLHKYALMDVPLDSAVEAEALAQLIDTDLDEPSIETVRLTFAIDDEGALESILAQDKRLEDYQIDPNSQEEDETQRPRSAHILLDREFAATGVDIGANEIPHVEGFLSVYGKRTDREARLVVTADRGPSMSDVQQSVESVFAGTIGDLLDTEVVRERPLSEDALSWRWRMPDDTPLEHRRRLVAQQRREAILDRWPKVSRGPFGGKSLEEAAKDESLRIPLLSSVLILEQSTSDPEELGLFEELRAQYDIPHAQEIDPKSIDLQTVPLVRVPRLKLSEVDTDELLNLQERAVLIGANLATLLISLELVERENLPEDVDLSPAYRRLIRLIPDPQKAFSWIERARAWSKSREESESTWALLELETAIQTGEGSRVQIALNELRDRHMEEPGVAEETYRLLYAAGLIDPNQMASQPAPGVAEPIGAATASAESQAIWTPGADSPSSLPASDDDKPAIWTP